MADLEKVTLKNVKLNWAFLAKPNTKGEFASNKYEVQVVIPDKAQAEIVEDLKGSSQDLNKTDEGWAITLRSAVKPRVVDKSKRILEDDVVEKIGNGTLALVSARQFVGFKGKVFLGLNGVMIKDMVEYTGADPFSDIEAEPSDDDAPFDTDEDELV